MVAAAVADPVLDVVVMSVWGLFGLVLSGKCVGCDGCGVFEVWEVDALVGGYEPVEVFGSVGLAHSFEGTCVRVIGVDVGSLPVVFCLKSVCEAVWNVDPLGRGVDA